MIVTWNSSVFESVSITMSKADNTWRLSEMLRNFGLGVIAVCIATALLICPATCQSKVANRISTGQAERLVQAWVKTHRDKCYWHDHPKLKEVTTRDVWERLHAQVFKQSDYTQSISEVEAYLIKDGNAYPMSVGFGGWGLTEMCVSDIDNDSNDELVYTYSWGSGMHRSHIEAYHFGGQSPIRIIANFTVAEADIGLKKQGEHNVDLYITDVSGVTTTNQRLGELILKQKDKHEWLDIKLDAMLPNEWKPRIWRIGAKAK